MYIILLYYKYTEIKNPKELMEAQRELCEELHLKGRIIIATEGINGTVEGFEDDIKQFIEEMTKDSRFCDIQWKKSNGTGDAFPKLSVKVRSEIVSSYLEEKNINPNNITGKYITPDELHYWLHPKKGTIGKEFYIVDMRNDFETKSGYFENSIFPGLRQFRDLKSVVLNLEHLKNKTIVTVCTGGVRCAKASGFLMTQGFNDVYQLKGGIVSYMEKYPNMDFKGKLYVFDKRLVMGFNTDSIDHTVVGVCEKCGNKSEHYINCSNTICHRHFILCVECSDEKGEGQCPKECGVYHPYRY